LNNLDFSDIIKIDFNCKFEIITGKKVPLQGPGLTKYKSWFQKTRFGAGLIDFETGS
jgi:hypothetical protein